MLACQASAAIAPVYAFRLAKVSEKIVNTGLHSFELEYIFSDKPALQQEIAPIISSFPAESTHEVLHWLHGSLGETIFEALQFTAACLHKLKFAVDDWPENTPVMNKMITAEMPKTAAIITRYSREPCACSMIE